MTPSADLDLAVRGIVFAAAGTAGQRCTSLRRLIVHSSVADDVVARVVAACRTLPVGDPCDPATLIGPLIHETAYRDMLGALDQARAEGGEVIDPNPRRDGPRAAITSHRRWSGCRRRPPLWRPKPSPPSSMSSPTTI
ncbi:aldehyde dehydrogenase family protein [Mycobacterium ulcerans str. Harvey]|uniref:Aldehyde dehydrogenase family protein n=1 Tax=Mycobacterium ulcerans str. Harvey TaxID=1299332 RepID=A0ABN0QX64_MYCUL|nr:aldehyde dehydrogenase family protein [Mycobacterium ulcerans str. Harvey]